MPIRYANYGFFELVQMVISKVLTILIFPNARLVRFPHRIRGKKALHYGKGFTTGYSCRIEMSGDISQKKLILGENCIIGDYAHIVANQLVRIGNNVLIGSRVFISDTSHGNYRIMEIMEDPTIPPNMRKLSYSPVRIGDNVWIGENVSILPGVTIGSGSIIGANSVVTKDIDENSIVVGFGSRVVKKYSNEKGMWE